MAVMKLKVNGTTHSVDADPETPLLWVLRDTLSLTGTKYSCGQGLCGSCTVHIDGEAVRSCVTPVMAAEGKDIVTIEGLAAQADHPVLEAWRSEEVPQCGYCQPGQIMQAAALLSRNPQPKDDEITEAMQANLCRCGTYLRIRKAIHRAAAKGGVR